jgi:hypothetical protein
MDRRRFLLTSLAGAFAAPLAAEAQGDGVADRYPFCRLGITRRAERPVGHIIKPPVAEALVFSVAPD